MANLNPGNDINAALASQRASSDPQFVAMVQRLQQLQQTQSGVPWNLTPEGSQLAQQIQQRAQQLGIKLGTGFWNGGQVLDPATGKIQFHSGDVDTVAPAMLAAAVGSEALSGAFTGGAAAPAGGTLPSTATVPTTGSLAAGGSGLPAGAAGGSSAAAGGGAVAGGASAAAAVAPNIWKQILVGGAISAGAAVVGGAIAAHGQTKAAEIQAAETDKQLAQAKEIYDQMRKDEGPYRQSGYSSLNALNFGLGLPAVDVPTDTTNAPSYANGQPPPTGQPFSPASLNQLGQYAQSAQGTPWGGAAAQTQAKMQQVSNTTVQVKAPNGTVYTIPVTRLPEALQQGGVRV